MAFTAKYRGLCVQCDDEILPGQRVEFNDDRDLMHVLCPEDTSLGKPRPVCPSCFIVLPVTGKCEECFPDD